MTTQTEGYILRAEGCTKRFSDKLLFEDLSFVIPSHGVLAIRGPSGCGKTTLLRCIAGLESLDEGCLRLNLPEIDNPNFCHPIAMVFQDLQLWPHMTTLENVKILAREVCKMTEDESCASAKAVLASLGLTSEVHRYPSELSGGEQQRVAVARALMVRPRLFLLDEITASLDAMTEEQVLSLVDESRSAGAAIVMVAHDQAVTRRFGGTILEFQGGGKWSVSRQATNE